MQFFKKELTEKEAALYAVKSVFLVIEKRWPSIKQKMKSQFEETFSPQLPSFAPIDLAFAIIALDLQALPNLFPKEQSERIHEFVLSEIMSEKENGSYGYEEVILYEKEFLECVNNPHTDKYLYTEGNPILAIARRLANRWLGADSEKKILGKKILSPILVMIIAELITSLTGTWKIIHTDFKITSPV